MLVRSCSITICAMSKLRPVSSVAIDGPCAAPALRSTLMNTPGAIATVSRFTTSSSVTV